MTREAPRRAWLVSSSGGFFPYRLNPVPDSPTECQSCGATLEPLRRYAGLCKACVAARPKRRRRHRPQRIVRRFVRHGETYLELECGCGARRVMHVGTYNTQRPAQCKRCQLHASRWRGRIPVEDKTNKGG